MDNKHGRCTVFSYRPLFRKVETEGWSAELSQYQDGDNPFGDDAITQPFRWEKKLEKEGMTNLKVKLIKLILGIFI